MKIKIVMMGIVLILSGCATKTVYVPSGCPKVSLPAEPHYPMQDLKKDDKPDKVAKAYAASFQLAYDYIHQQLLPIMRVYK